MARPLKLTPDVQARIVAFVRAGAFDWVAAQATGIGSRTFYTWMEMGARPRGRRQFRQFRQEVLAARAEARITAEVETRKDNPLAWLRFGPGRDRPGEPGWTESSTVNVNGARPGEPLEIVIREIAMGRDEHADARTAGADAPPSPTNGDRRGTPV